MSALSSKIIDVLVNPINKFIVIAAFFTSLLLFLFNFLPIDLLKRTNMLGFLNRYTFIVVIIMIFTFFILIIQECARRYKLKKDKEFNEFFKKEQDKLIQDKYARLILNQLFENRPNSVHLPSNNQKVQLLIQYQLIHRTSSLQIVTAYGANDPHFPYVLQPYAEERLEEIYK
ncbi:super-infection exclusion protein B [Staphylococcus haemolyticus]|uniref:super-infection exclusion protein B n=1 Tax=Staphylococcus haemolyticus TaxID=1283 RepID=UPI001F42D2AB|nr:super-infection exclusion protein B [Staphylococcus haemolyticus]MCE4988083.1 superinfection exclusion B family protein [Staphylococcus haemolyticus]